MRRGLLFLLGLALVACLKRPLALRAPTEVKAAVAYVFDPEIAPEISDVPPGVKDALARELQARNVRAEALPFSQVAETFGALKDSKLRFQALLKKAPPEANYVLLVETRASFFSQLNGRYRYIVTFRLTGARREGSEEPVQWSFDEPTYTNFDHERELEALEAAQNLLSDKAGQLFDSLLQLAPAPPPPATPVAPPVPARMGRSTPPVGPVYFAMVDRFHNGDVGNDVDVDRKNPSAFHGGDLQGVLDKLDALEEMGIRTVWLSPIFKMRTEPFFGHGAFHGYWVEDLRQLEPRFGTEALLQKLAEELRRRDMGLVLDMVYNHVAPDSKWVPEKPHWFHRLGPITDWNDVSQLTSHDVHGLPDLAQENEEVYRYLMDATVKWAQALRPVGLRLDAVKHVPLEFWARFNGELRTRLPFPLTLVGEMYEGSPSSQARVQKEGNFDAMFDFPLYFAQVDVFCKDAPAFRLASVLSQDSVYANPQSLWTFADNHDLPRILSDCGDDSNKVAQLLTFQLLARGTPSLSWGTEYGAQGSAEPHNRMSLSPNSSFLKGHISRLLHLRQGRPALSGGDMYVEAIEEDWGVFSRIHRDDVVLVAVNVGETGRRWPLPEGIARNTVMDVLSQKPLPDEALFVAPSSVRVLGMKAPVSFAQARAQRAHARRWVEFEAAGDALVGAGPHLGDWKKELALKAPSKKPLRLLLPVGSVLEYKWLRQGASGETVFEDGRNRFVHVPEGAGPLRVKA